MKSLALAILGAYKRWISPLLLPSCRYVPTCSEYAMEAVDRYGVMRGGVMALWRLLRCHPFAKGGHDPVVKDAFLSHGCGELPLRTHRSFTTTALLAANGERRTTSN